MEITLLYVQICNFEATIDSNILEFENRVRHAGLDGNNSLHVNQQLRETRKGVTTHLAQLV